MRAWELRYCFVASDSAWSTSQYDISKPCPTLHENLCYSTTDRIKSLLDDRKTRKKLGVPEDRPEFVGCSNAVSVTSCRPRPAFM